MAPMRWVNSTNCQKGQSTIPLRYPVLGTVLAGTGFEKMAGYPANRNRIFGTSLPITTRENTSLAIHVAQKMTIIYAQKIRKFVV